MPDGSFAPDPTTLRLRLLANGWAPLPVSSPDLVHPKLSAPGKAPFFTGWNKITPETLTADTVRAWPQTIQNHPGTGLACGRLAVADIDVLDAAVVRRIKALAFDFLAPTPFLRIGRAPKLALLYRLAEPTDKLMTPFFDMPGGETARVEILGAGQQMVAYGIHPGTRCPYEWPEQAPDAHPFGDVPLVTVTDLQAFLSAAEAVLRHAGGVVQAKAEKPAKAAPKPATTTPKARKMEVASDYPPPTREEVAEALAAIPSADDWHGWHRIGAALFDALADDGEALFHEWSAGSAKYDRDTATAKWRSFGSSPATVKAATLFYEARQHGWKPARERERAARAQDAAETAATATDLELTEDGIALAFTAKHGTDLR